MVWRDFFPGPQSGFADMALPKLGRYGLRSAKKNARGASRFMTLRRREFHFSFGGRRRPLPATKIGSVSEPQRRRRSAEEHLSSVIVNWSLGDTQIWSAKGV